MNATPEWMKDLNDQAEDALEEPQDALEEEYVEEAPPEEAEVEAQEETRQQPESVPLATLLEERRKYQEQLDQERQRASRFERLEDELRRMRAERQNVSRETPQPERKPPPDYLEDPQGYVDATKEDLIERLKKLEGESSQTRQAAQAMAFERQLRESLAAAESAYVAQQPDYYDALQYVRAIKSRELAVTYPQAKPEQITQLLNQQELGWGAQLLRSGVNPSEQAYKLAQALGYEGKTGQNQGQDKGQQPAKESGSGVDRRRLQGMGGAQAGKAGPTDSELERLMDGSPDEFDQAMSELFGKRGR